MIISNSIKVSDGAGLEAFRVRFDADVAVLVLFSMQKHQTHLLISTDYIPFMIKVNGSDTDCLTSGSFQRLNSRF